MPSTPLLAVDAIAKRILFIRGQRVMLDADHAELYGVETRVFNQAVNTMPSASTTISCSSSPPMSGSL